MTVARAKAKIPSLRDVAVTSSRNHIAVQSHEDVPVQLRDSDVPNTVAASRRAAKGTREGDVHRSLYAKPETMELVRRIAFEDGTTAQALYREGLLLMLQKRGHCAGMSADDL